MADDTRTEQAQRPPPLPSTKARSAAGGVFAKVKAFLEIRRLRAVDGFRRLGAWAARRKLAASLAGLAIVVVVGGGLAYAFEVFPELDFHFSSTATVGEAARNVRDHPKEGSAQRDLGHALFAAKRRAGGVAAYRKALALDPGAADDQMLKNLVACFGTPQQDAAEAIIWKSKLVGTQVGLEALVGSRRSSVRWGAVQTLDRLKKGTKANWETAYILDLDSASCDVRRRAVEKLGEVGTRRAVKALHAAKADDEKTGGWFRSPCLGERLDASERQILARR